MTVTTAHVQSSWHSLIPSNADSLNSDLRRLSDSRSCDSILDNSLFDILHLLLTGHSTGTVLASKWSFSQVKVTLRLTVSQSLSLGVEPHLGLMTRYLLLFDSYGLVFMGRPLWREDGSVFCVCCWPLPAQSFSGPRPMGLATIFYCFRFETFLFVASYDSQGHGDWLFSTELFFITTLHGPFRKHSLSVAGKACLQRRCITTEVIRLLLAYSLQRECVVA
jgi:hypothetical protein